MSKKSIVSISLVGLSLLLLIPYSAQTKDSLRVIRINITDDGRFVPARILVKQDEEVIFRITAHKSNELTWTPEVLHGFYLLYDNILLVGKTIRIESKEKTDKATSEVKWTPRFAGEFTIRCPYHQHKFGTVIVKQ